MNLVVTLEYRFSRTPDGKYWTLSAYAPSFWNFYLSVFDSVCVVARVRDVPTVADEWQRVDGNAVSFVPVPYYVGPRQYLGHARAVAKSVKAAATRADAVIMRVPSQIANLLAPVLRKRGQPFGLEVVGNPWDVFAPGTLDHPLRPFFRAWFSHRLRKLCLDACGVAYVTERFLQERYPAAPGAFVTHYSSVELSDTSIALRPRQFSSEEKKRTLIFVGSLAQLYKAPEVLIDAVAHCLKGGLDLELLMVGDGRYRPALETRAAALGLGQRVHFLGELPAGQAVRDQMDLADIFVLPSRVEGLPRVVIEAMGRALPCVGSTAGGIPELLPNEDLVLPGDSLALARKIREVATDADRLSRMSARNLQKAREYRQEVESERRTAFYLHVKQTTEEFQRARGV